MLAERFAAKCFTPLELTHFKDNFFSRALEQGGLRYWNEKVLSDSWASQMESVPLLPSSR